MQGGYNKLGKPPSRRQRGTTKKGESSWKLDIRVAVASDVTISIEVAKASFFLAKPSKLEHYPYSLLEQKS